MQYELGEVCSRLSSGKSINANLISPNSQYPVFGGNGLRGYTSKSNFNGECVIIGRQGAFCGNTRYFNGEAYMTEHAVVAVGNKLCNTHYLAYLLSTMNLGKYSGQSAQPGLSVMTLSKIIVDLPPLLKQIQISSLLNCLDEKIESNNKVNDNLAKQISLYQSRLINSNRASFKSVRLGDLLYIKGRIGWKGLKKEEYLDSSDYRIINGESLTNSGINWDKAGFISKERFLESPEIALNVGDILLSKDGTIGKIGYADILDKPTTVASGIFVIRNTEPDLVSNQFIYFLLISSLFSSFIKTRTEGSVIPHLYQRDFTDFVFPLPDKNSMIEFNKVTSPMFSLYLAKRHENENLIKTRDALLPKLMSGEIDVSDVEA